MLKYLQLGKWHIAVPVALSGFTGSILFYPRLHWLHVLVLAGIFLLAMAASAINQLQERDIDPLYPRTNRRPLLTGRIPVNAAMLYILTLIAAGCGLLWLMSPVATGIGILTIVWYNGVYTPMKRVSAFAAIPGALVGALPPYIGWTAAGGSLTELAIAAVAAVFFFAQIPHFWLIVLKYRKEYLMVPQPSVVHVFSEVQLRRIVFVWLLATSFMPVLLVVYNVLCLPVFKLLAGGTALLYFVSVVILSPRLVKLRKAFSELNLLVLLLMILIWAHQLVRVIG